MRHLFWIVIKVIFIIVSANADNVRNILDVLDRTNSINFKFVQITDDKREKGECILLFSNNLKCFYDDKNNKELTISNNKLTVFQKRYNKIYQYPLKDSPYTEILDKKKLKEFVSNSKLMKKNDNIILNKENKVNIFFSKNKNELLGWEFIDQFNNKVTFNISILKTNVQADKNLFRHPEVN